MIKRAAIIVLWICVIASGISLRFEDLAKRPFHADEATGARLVGRRMEGAGGQFDPKHYHGPLLSNLAIPLSRMRGETHWRELSKSTLRTLPALAGCLLVLLPLLWRRRYGDAPTLLAAAFLATSPLLVYYSRMYIHESLLVLFGIMAVVSLTRYPRWAIPGVLIGLMFAVKETFAISLIAWAAAGVLVALERRNSLTRDGWIEAWHQYRLPVALSMAAAAVTAAGFYSEGFHRPQGVIDALRTFFVYETVEGHDKPFGYYAQLLALPKKSGGVWWFETPLLVLALWAYAATYWRGGRAIHGNIAIIRFLAYAALAHFLIYSLIGYKTPWLACLPWAHVCCLAGFALAPWRGWRPPPLQMAVLLVAAAGLFSQFKLSRLAAGRFASDERNPYAYVPTRGDIEAVERWLAQLQIAVPAGTLEPVAVVGTDYWPLPWYLRSFKQVGYWAEPPADLPRFGLVFVLPESADQIVQALADSHMALPRGLRAGVPVYVLVRNDLWQSWMQHSPSS